MRLPACILRIAQMMTLGSLLFSCAPKPDAGLLQMKGTITANFDGLVLLRVSNEDYKAALEAYERTRAGENKGKVGFMSFYFDRMCPAESHRIPINKFRFQTRVPGGKYVLAYPDKEFGWFVPVDLNTDLDLNLDKSFVIMMRSENFP